MTADTTSPVKGRFRFGSKAETLARLEAYPSDIFRLCPQVLVTRPRWTVAAADVVAEIVEQLGNAPLAVRSSAANEDGWDQSLAGANLSLMHVQPDPQAIESAVHRVFASYQQADNGEA